VGADPVRQRLGPGGFGVSVFTGAKDGHEDLGVAYLAGCGIDDGKRPAAVVDEEFVAGAMFLTRGDVELLVPERVPLAEVAVLISMDVHHRSKV